MLNLLNFCLIFKHLNNILHNFIYVFPETRTKVQVPNSRIFGFYFYYFRIEHL